MSEEALIPPTAARSSSQRTRFAHATTACPLAPWLRPSQHPHTRLLSTEVRIAKHTISTDSNSLECLVCDANRRNDHPRDAQASEHSPQPGEAINMVCATTSNAKATAPPHSVRARTAQRVRKPSQRPDTTAKMNGIQPNVSALARCRIFTHGHIGQHDNRSPLRKMTY